jgi:hypothetical protein
MLTRAIQRSLSWARSIQSIPPYPVSLRSILILSTHIRLGLPSGLFTSGSPTNIIYALLFSSHLLATCPVYLSLSAIILIILGSSLCSVVQPPVTSSLFGPNILHNTLSLCSFLNVTDEVSHPWKQLKRRFNKKLSKRRSVSFQLSGSV